MRKIIKRIWFQSEAEAYVRAVESGKRKYGLKYLSACDFLRRTPIQPKQGG